jgi:hypothetical protein
MAITDIEISEELMTNAPSIKYSGNEGPKSPQEIEAMMMADAVLQEEYEKYVFDLLEIRPEATPMTLEEFRQMVIAEGLMSGGQPLPEDPTKPVNPFAPKPTGPVLPDRQMAAYGGIMGMDGRKQYGIGSFFQSVKDKFVDDIIPNEIKDNPLLTAAAVAAGDYYLNDRSYLDNILKGTKDFILGGETTRKISGPDGDEVTTKNPNILKRILGSSTGEDRTVGGDILGSIAKNIVPIVGGIGAGLFTKNTESDTPGLPSDDTALNLADYKKAANLLNQKQGLAAGMNFLPTVASRKYSPEEMAITYAQAANGGRIGMADGGIMDLGGMEKDFRNTGGFVDIGAKEKADDVPARLSVNEFVMTADAVRGMGDGDIDLGAKRMENLMGAMENKKGAQQMFDVSERLSEVV